MPIQETRVRFGPVIGRRLGKGRAPSGHHGIGPGQRLDPSGAVCCARFRCRHRADDHSRATGLLKASVTDGPRLALPLGRLVDQEDEADLTSRFRAADEDSGCLRCRGVDRCSSSSPACDRGEVPTFRPPPCGRPRLDRRRSPPQTTPRSTDEGLGYPTGRTEGPATHSLHSPRAMALGNQHPTPPASSCSGHPLDSRITCSCAESPFAVS